MTSSGFSTHRAMLCNYTPKCNNFTYRTLRQAYFIVFVTLIKYAACSDTFIYRNGAIFDLVATLAVFKSGRSWIS